jgi:hypothetical protein
MSSGEDRSMLRTLLAVGLALLMGPLAAAQVAEQDPRYGDDPRVGQDPRLGDDPRVGEDPRDVPPDPYTVYEGTELFEALYNAGETGRLKIAMRENAWDLLPWIDSYCDRWLKLAERPEPISQTDLDLMQKAAAKGLELARMADASLGDTRFGFYVDNITSWNDEQRAQFKQEQKSFEMGMKIWRSAGTPADAHAALTPMNQALSHARMLGDTWGEASTYAMIGRIQISTGQLTEGRRSIDHAIRVGRQIRDMDAVWDGLAITYQASVELGSWEAAREALKDQYMISLEVGDEDTTEKLMSALVEYDQYVEDLLRGSYRLEQPDPLVIPQEELDG